MPAAAAAALRFRFSLSLFIFRYASVMMFFSLDFHFAADCLLRHCCFDYFHFAISLRHVTYFSYIICLFAD